MCYKIISLLLLTCLIRQLNCSESPIIIPAKSTQKNYDVLDAAVPVPALQAIIMGYLDSWDQHNLIEAESGAETRGFAFLEQDKRIAIIYHPNKYEQTIKILDIETGSEVQRLDEAARIWSIHYLPARNWLAILSFNFSLKIYDFNTGMYLVFGWPLHCLSYRTYSADGKNIAFNLFGGVRDNDFIKIWDTKTGAETRLPAPDGQIAYSPDCNYLASVASDTISIWDLKTQKIIKTLKEDSKILQINYSPDGNYLAASKDNDGTITIWDIKSGLKTRTINTQSRWKMTDFIFSPDGNYIAVGCQSELKQCIQIFDILTGTAKAKLTNDIDANHEVAYSTNGCYLAARSSQSVVTKKHGVQIWVNTAKIIEAGNSKNKSEPTCITK